MKTAADACVVYDLKRSKWGFKHEGTRLDVLIQFCINISKGKLCEACTPGATFYVPWHLSDDALCGTWGWHAVGRTYHNQSRQLFLWKQRQLSCCRCVLICHTVMMRSWSLLSRVALCVNLNDIYKPHVPNSRNTWRFWIANIFPPEGQFQLQMPLERAT